ncbi:MAG: hypothetical protein KatS3mg107_0909 [Gemmataceae bacterium]|nr:MAG: hypothetical protein KatS3mg107_0909 [Gemmataceae bacterium]
MNEPLSHYLEQLQNGEISPEAMEALAELLRSGTAGDRALFLEGLLLDVYLHEAFAEERSLAEHFVVRPPALGEVAVRERRWKGAGNWIVATCAICLLIALGIGLHGWWRQTEEAPLDPAPIVPQAPAILVAKLKEAEGDVLIVSQEKSVPAHPGQLLLSGQGIMTRGAESQAVLAMDDDTKMNLSGEAVVFPTLQGEENAQLIVVEQGNLVMDVGKVLQRKMKVQTSLGTAVAESETSLHILDGMGLAVVRGEVHFTHKTSGKSLAIKEGHYLLTAEDRELSLGRFFLGKGTDWAVYPRFGLDVRAVALRLAFSRDGKWLAAANRVHEKGIRFGPAENIRPPLELLGQFGVAFSPDGKALAAGGRERVVLYDLPPDKPPRVLMDKRNLGEKIVECLAFSPDGRTLATAQNAGDVLLWDLTTGAVQAKYSGHNAAITSLVFSPDGALLASASLDSSVIIRDAILGVERARIECPPELAVWAVSFSPDGATLAIATGPRDFRLRHPVGDVRLWDVTEQRIKRILRGHTRAVTSLAFSSDGRTLVTGSADTTVRFWDLTNGTEYGMLKGHKGAVGFESLSVALSPDGKYLATGSNDCTVKVWKTTALLKNNEPTDSLARTNPWSDAESFRPRSITLAEPIRSNYQRLRYR